MGSDSIVLLSPLFDQDFGFLQGVEDLAIEQFVAELAVETLDIPVLPGAARFDEQGLSPQLAEPGAELLVGKLAAVIRTQMDGNTAGTEQPGQASQYIFGFQAAPDTDRQAFTRVFVDDVQGAEGPSIVGAVGHKVIAPDMVGIFRA